MGTDQLFKKKKFRNANELARGKAKKSPYETITIVCEDSKSSLEYFKELRTHFRLNTANITPVSSKGSAPISVIDHAIEIARNTPDIDRVFCVLDRDEHESYERALNKLKNFNVNRNKKSEATLQAITSTPCYEIWLLLHFCYTTKAYRTNGTKSAGENLVNDLTKHLPSYKKSNAAWFGKIINNLEIAIKHAKQLQKHNTSTNSTNPSTNMHEIVGFLAKFKK